MSHIMKKATPCICALVYGVFGGALIESVILFLSIMSSPFSEPDNKPLLILCVVASVLSALVIITAVIVNSAYLIDLDNKRKTIVTSVTELIISLGLLFLFWNLWGLILRDLSHMSF